MHGPSIWRNRLEIDSLPSLSPRAYNPRILFSRSPRLLTVASLYNRALPSLRISFVIRCTSDINILSTQVLEVTMSRPSGPPPYTAQEIALLDTPEKRFIAQAELNSTSS